MSKKRNQYSASFKFKVALAALKGDQTTSEIAARFQIHPTMVITWKRELLENAPNFFEGKKKAGKQSDEPCTDELYREIGRLTVERDFCRASSFSKPSTAVGDDRAWSSPSQSFAPVWAAQAEPLIGVLSPS